VDINTEKEITNIQKVGADEQMSVGSGTYHFVYTLQQGFKHSN
jgi:alpha-L-rhamnosidase